MPPSVSISHTNCSIENNHLIFFDIDKTLLDHDHAMRQGARRFQAEFADIFSLSEEAFTQRWTSLADRAYRRYLDGRLSLDAARIWRMQTLFQTAGVVLKPEEALEMAHTAIAYYTENWQLFPDVIPGLERVAHRRLGIISNGDARQQREKLERLQLTSYFDTIHISSEIGVAKPAAAIFEYACRDAGYLTGACLYVGDQLEGDARAAARAGMTGIWLNRNGAAVESTPLEKVYAMHSLAELPREIKKINLSASC
jgi:putative hydrolase of the HAD superfamily